MKSVGEPVRDDQDGRAEVAQENREERGGRGEYAGLDAVHDRGNESVRETQRPDVHADGRQPRGVVRA